MKKAYRNLMLCTKDCLCLYVCPTGATDTEDSIIDLEKCIGCGVCAESCPSKAISMLPEELPPQQPKTDAVKAALGGMAQRKADEEKQALQLAQNAGTDGLYRLMNAIAKSSRLVAEDLMREAGYMLAQSANSRELLKEIAQMSSEEDMPAAAAKKLLEKIKFNE